MRLAITGAAGAVGAGLRPHLRGRHELVLLDRRPPADPAPGEAWRVVDVTDRDATRAALEGCEAVLHLACVHAHAIGFEETLDVNYRGTIATYDAAVAAGARHLIYTSSNHGWGFRRAGEGPLGEEAAPAPDGWYGVSKLWGEAATAFYAEAHGLHGTSLRIGHANDHVPTPRQARMWVSFGDLADLVDLVLARPAPGHRALWATADCAAPFFDNAAARALGWTPRDRPDPIAPPGTGPGPGDDMGGPFAAANRARA